MSPKFGDETQSALPIFDAIYEGLDHPIPFSGGLLLGRDFIENLYVHMGFHPAWKFREVHELIFEEGRLIREVDQSESMEKVRQVLESSTEGSWAEPSEPEVLDWIASQFNLDYRPRRRRSRLAVASLVLSLGGLLVGPLASIPAIVTGTMARRRIRANPGLRGGGMALAGIIIGWTVTALILAFAILSAIGWGLHPGPVD